MKKVSVVIPIYKVENYIATTIQSVLNQTYQNFEILVVDDASPDNSVTVCQQFTDPRVKLIRQENRGPSGALNTGIRQAQGEYIALLDGDDTWLPEKLEKHLQHLEKSPKVGVSFSRSAFIDEAGEALDSYQMPKLTDITVPYLLRCNPLGNGSAAVYRREVFDAICFQENLRGYVEDCYFDEHFRMSQDIECLLRIAIQTPWEIEGIPEVLTLYRQTSGGVSSNLLKKIEVWAQLFEKTRSYAPELVREWEKPSKAYELRYLARKAIRLQSGAMAVKLIHQSLATYWRIILEEPRPTLMTWVAAYLLWLLPGSLYSQTEALVAKVIGGMQKRRILQDQTGQSA